MTGQEIRQTIQDYYYELRAEHGPDDGLYLEAEDEVLAMASDDEIVAYNRYMAAITGIDLR